MTYSTLKGLAPGKHATDMLTLQNANGTGPLLWGVLCERYLGSRHLWMFNSAALWNLQARTDIPACLRVMLLFTCDLAYIGRADYQRTACHIREALLHHLPASGSVNHWAPIAHLFEGEPSVPAIALRCTSSADDLFAGTLDEKTGEHSPPDWTDFWNVYSEPWVSNQ